MNIQCPYCNTDITVPVENVNQSQSWLRCNYCDSIVVPKEWELIEDSFKHTHKKAFKENKNIKFKD